MEPVGLQQRKAMEKAGRSVPLSRFPFMLQTSRLAGDGLPCLSHTRKSKQSMRDTMAVQSLRRLTSAATVSAATFGSPKRRNRLLERRSHPTRSDRIRPNLAVRNPLDIANARFPSAAWEKPQPSLRHPPVKVSQSQSKWVKVGQSDSDYYFFATA